MLGVQTDMLRFDQQFMRDTHTTMVSCNLTDNDPAGIIRPYQQNFFTNQNQLNGRTITGITAYGNFTNDVSQLGLGTPVGFANFNLFLLTIVDFNGEVRLSQFPVDVLSDPNTGAVTYPFTKRFSIYNVNWSASYVMANGPVNKAAIGNTILFNIQFV